MLQGQPAEVSQGEGIWGVHVWSCCLLPAAAPWVMCGPLHQGLQPHELGGGVTIC
jgi:hypothetical protein